jgi:hypothetical protein
VRGGRAQCLCRLLDRTPSERSEDKLVFLINGQPIELFLERSFHKNDCSLKERSNGSAAERMGIDDESDQVP